MHARYVGACAVFGLDNTLVRGSSLYYFGRALAAHGLLDPRRLLPHVLAEACFRCGRGERLGRPDRVAASIKGLVGGCEVSTLSEFADAWAPEFLQSHGIRCMVDAVQEFREHGFGVVIATASLQELAESFATCLQADAGIGTVAEVRSGRFWDVLASRVAQGPVKAHEVSSWLQERCLDAAGSWAFSGSVNDTPLLNLVGLPVVVNADARLRGVAKERGWRSLRGSDPWPGLQSLGTDPSAGSCST